MQSNSRVKQRDYGAVILSMLIQTLTHMTDNAHTSKPKHLHQRAKAQAGLICQNAGAQKPKGTPVQITNGDRLAPQPQSPCWPCSTAWARWAHYIASNSNSDIPLHHRCKSYNMHIGLCSKSPAPNCRKFISARASPHRRSIQYPNCSY